MFLGKPAKGPASLQAIGAKLLARAQFNSHISERPVNPRNWLKLAKRGDNQGAHLATISEHSPDNQPFQVSSSSSNLNSPDLISQKQQQHETWRKTRAAYSLRPEASTSCGDFNPPAADCPKWSLISRRAGKTATGVSTALSTRACARLRARVGTGQV